MAEPFWTMPDGSHDPRHHDHESDESELRECLGECVRLHLASSHPGEPLWLLLAARTDRS